MVPRIFGPWHVPTKKQLFTQALYETFNIKCIWPQHLQHGWCLWPHPLIHNKCIHRTCTCTWSYLWTTCTTPYLVLHIERSPSAQDAFQPIPGLIRCAGVTGNVGTTHTHTLYHAHAVYRSLGYDSGRWYWVVHPSGDSVVTCIHTYKLYIHMYIHVHVHVQAICLMFSTLHTYVPVGTTPVQCNTFQARGPTGCRKNEYKL